MTRCIQTTLETGGRSGIHFSKSPCHAPQSVLLIVETDPEAFRAKYEVPRA